MTPLPLLTGLSVEYMQSGSSSFFNITKPLNLKNLQKYLFETDRIDAFFSHVWSTSPLLKHLGVLWYLNARRASFASLILASVFACALIPIDVRSWVQLERNSGFTAPSLISIFGTCCILILLWSFDHTVPSFLLRICLPQQSRRFCFIDRCCIDQENPVEKSRGIHDIPSFLDQSDRLVILLSEEYFDRLWCCYELAVFRSSRFENNPNRAVVFIPLKFVSITILMTLSDMLSAVLFRSNFRSLLSKGNDITFIFISAFFGITTACLAYYAAQLWAEEFRRIKQRISSFTLDKVSCTDEDDRVLLLQDIDKRFDGASNFEAVVRSEIIDEIGKRPKFKFTSFIALPTIFSLMGYACILGQRMTLSCIYELGTTAFKPQDDSTCIVLDRAFWVNVLLIFTDLTARIFYYPVILGTVLWFNSVVHRFSNEYLRIALHISGLLSISAAVVAENLQYDNVILSQVLKAGTLVSGASLIYLGPFVKSLIKSEEKSGTDSQETVETVAMQE